MSPRNKSSGHSPPDLKVVFATVTWPPCHPGRLVKKNNVKLTLTVGLIALLLFCLPLMGVWLSGEEILPYLTLPPGTEHVPAAPFSWAAFVFLAAAIVLCLAPFLLHLFRSQKNIERYKAPSPGGLPWWGRVGLVVFLFSWLLAWTRFPWFERFQACTFEPLWLSYILVVNALTHKRTGGCMLTKAPVTLLSLFVMSAVFWWFFEYLNRFVGNWSYHNGPGVLSALNVHASVSFSTVLPGVTSTCDLIGTFPRIRAGMDRFVKVDASSQPLAPWLVLLFSCTVLAGIGVWPDLLFPALWVAPLLLILSVQAIAGYPTILSPLKTGDWSRMWLMVVSALVCGFFWEMWNFFSLAHWEYAIPYVGRFHIFEMPLLGYAGYFPFGLECAVIADCVRRVLPPAAR